MAVNRAVKPSKKTGEPLEIYELVNIPKPKASPKNVVVKVLLRPVNPTDFLTVRHGWWGGIDLKEAVVGSEGYGVIHEVGEGATKYKVGQRVIPLIWSRYYTTAYGLWRDYVEVPEIDIVPVPDNISDKVAAQFLINPWTAYGMLNQLAVPKGGYFLQTGASSVLGRQIIQLAKYMGIKSINVVRRASWIQPLKDLGADYVIDSSTEDVKAKVLEITGGEGAYGGLDPVAGDGTRLVASLVRPGGQVLVYGSLSGSDIVVIGLDDFIRKVAVEMFLVSDFSHDFKKREETTSAVFDLLSKKIIEPQLGTAYPLEQFKEAIKESEKDARDGKVFISSY